jgi:hypothetical protein
VMAAIANLLFGITFTKYIGVNGVILATLVSYLVFVILPISIKTFRVLS